MPVDTDKLQEFMERYFGSMGDFLLSKEMKLLGLQDVHVADEAARAQLADAIVKDCLLTIMSDARARMAQTELYSILDIDEKAMPGVTRRSAL